MYLINYLRKILFFSLPVIILFLVVEILLWLIPNDFSYRYNRIIAKSDSIENLILGGSHAYYGLNPSNISPVTFNLSYVSQSLQLDYLVLDKLIDSLPKLKCVVIAVSYATFPQTWEEGEQKWRKYYYYRYYHIKPLYESWIHKYYPEIAFIPFSKCLSKIVDFIKGRSLITCTDYGWCPGYKTSYKLKDIEKKAEMAASRHEHGTMNFTPGIEMLNRILKLCRKHDIEVILVTFPSRPEYRKYVNQAKFEKMIKVSEEYSKNNTFVKYYNYSEDKRFIPDDFYDSDHLNTRGAEKFSEIFRNEAINVISKQ